LELVDQPVRAGQLLRSLVLPEQLIDQLVRDLHVAHHGPPSGPPDGIAPIAATPRKSRPRRTNQSDTQKSAHYLPRTRADFHRGVDKLAAPAVVAGGGMQAVIAATGLRTRKNVLHLIDPEILKRAQENDAGLPPAR
jgi:hypothetical protein